MPRILNIAVEVSDEEFAAFMERLGMRGQVSAHTGAPAGGNGDDETVVNTNAPQVDSAGVPWIEAVHAGGKTLNKDGTWRGKRGVSNEARAQAEAAAKVSSVPSMPGTAAPSMPGMGGGMPGMPSFPPIASAPVPQPVSYNDVVNKYQELAQAGKLANESIIVGIYQKIGITDVAQLQTDETLRRSLLDELNKL